MANSPGAHPAAQFAYRRLQSLLRLTRGACAFRIHYLIAISPSRLRVPPRAPRGLYIRALHSSDLDHLRLLRPATGVSYAERLRQGHRCLGAFLPGASSSAGDRLVAFVWVVRGPVRLPASFGCSWHISASMAWLYDLYSDAGVLGAVPHLYLYLQQHPSGAALQWWLGQTAFENRRSRLTHLSLGYQVLATLWTGKFGRRWWHLSRARVPSPRRWRAHASGAAIPLPLFAAHAASPPASGGTTPASVPGWRLQCACGAELPLSGPAFLCPDCGSMLGRRRGGVAEVGPPTPYWGELPPDRMRALLRFAAASGWRAAIRQHLSASLQRYVADPERAAFHELLPISPGARVLDVGAGWGSIAAPLARRFHVVALEGVPERARFIALRARQDGLHRLATVCGNVHNARLACAQFDAIVANGILEWSALFDPNLPPRAAQLQFLARLRELLRPGGCLYLAIENRCGWAVLRGAMDHSGLRYTSLLPRWLAHQVCRRHYRADNNTGYRTYTYSFRGYARLFAEAGFNVAASWTSPAGYNLPGKLLPPHTPALRFASAGRCRPWRGRALHALADHGWVLRCLASDFVFLLRPACVSAAPDSPSQRSAHA